ncbi:6-phosphogluconolactonase, cycloisomerase 2 family [Pseudomonas sp. 8Z]|uniref:putative Ig domain-containing protein n=1 Tax=Pseudomonas sp. 8Z TaxID=2653166 RepID=UPI0012EFD151|nr:putative Ig domain-containing protein [Pseudomonas sp. 8Z]VXD00606.1 6-phosphogluconolactonase, cycloisomerase 2 family [Pseudomonas sp. 8Z]
MTPRKPSSRYFRALALEPRILLDAAAVTTAAEVAAQVDTPASADAPGVKATPQNSVITITDSTDSFPPIDLFADVDVTLANDAEELSALVIRIEGNGANQALNIDGQSVALVNGASGMTAATGYSYSINVSGDVTTVNLSFDTTEFAPTAESVEALIDGLQYQVQSTAVESGPVRFTLDSLSDEGDTVDLNISATVSVDNRINVAPQIVSDGSLDSRESFRPEDLGISSGAEVVYSADGDYAYVAGNGAVTAFSVDAAGRLTQLDTLLIEGMNTATEMVISPDGRSIYLIDTLGAEQQSYNPDAIYVLSVDNGQLSHTATVDSGNGGITGGMALSDDGAYLYIGTASNDVAIFSRDASTGALTFLARTVGEGNSNSRNGSIAVSGNNVYVIYSGTNHVLISYERNSDGTLSKLSSLNTSAAGFGAVAYSMTVSQDGQYLYVAHPGDGTLATYSVSGTELALVESLNLNGVTSIALSEDGRLLYASTAQGAINVYSLASGGGLALLGSSDSGSPISDIAVASDGMSLLVSGNSQVTRLSNVQALNIGQPLTFANGLTLSDSNFDALAAGVGNYNGGGFSISADASGGSFAFASGNNLARSGNSITLGNTPIASFVVDASGALNVRFTADTSTAVANQVLQQITYTSASGTQPSSIVTLSVQANDGLLDGNSVSILLRSNEAPQANTAVSAALAPATSETAYRFDLPSNLFTDRDNDALTWTLSGLPQGLTFNPATRTIAGTTTETGTFRLSVTVTDTAGLSATREVDLVVEQIANRSPEVSTNAPGSLPLVVVGTNAYSQVLPADMFQDADAQYSDSTLTWSASGLPAGVSFDAATRTLSGTPTVIGDYSIAITVTDEHGATAEQTVTLRVISQAEADNTVPSISADGSALIYTADGRINGYSSAVYSIEISDDGRTVIVLGNDSTQHALNPTGNSTLTVYSRDPATGVLTELQRFIQGVSNDNNDANGIEVDGLVVAASAAYSADGKFLYLTGQNAGSSNYVLSTFAVNADGTLSATGQSVTLGSTAVKYIATSADGHVYAVAGNTLYAYSIGTDGALDSAQTFVDQEYNGTGYAIAIDAESRVFVTGTNYLAVYERDSDGQLLRVASHTGNIGNFVRTIAVSADGYVYISTGSPGSILTFHYDEAQKTLSTPSSLSASQVWGLQLSADGKTLFAGNSTGALHVYNIAEDGQPSFVKTVGYNGDSGDYRALRIAVSPDGSSLYVGSFYNFAGLGHIDVENAITASYTEGQTITPAAGLTLSDADYDNLANGTGNYNGATLTLQREGTANTDDRFGLSEANDLTLVDGNAIHLNGSKIADFSSEGGTLTVRFTADVSTATANAVLQQLTYSNASQDPAASIRLLLSVQDQYLSGTDSIALELAVTPINDAPNVTATAIANAVQDAGGAGARLFSGVDISTVENEQLINSLSLTVTGLSDGASETLRIDGTRIELVEGSGTTSNGYSWRVEAASDGTAATLTLSSTSGFTGEIASALIENLTYANTDRATGTTGERIVTLAAVQDNGGSANEGQDTATPEISSQVTVTVGQSPTLAAEIGAADLAELITSAEYPSPYDGLNGVVLAGDLVYAVRTGVGTDPDTFSDVPVSTLYIFQRGQDGTLSLLSSIESNTENGLLSASALGISADGTTLYAITDSGVALFGRDAASGELTALGLIASDLGFVNDVQINGDVAYISSFDGITLFNRSVNGWSSGATVTAPGDSAFTDLQLSSDNRYLYAATTGGTTLLSAFSINPDGSLGASTSITGGQSEHFADRLALSADGTSLYVIDGNNLYTLAVGADGTPQIVGDALVLEDSGKQLLINDEGSLLIVVSENSIVLFGRALDGSLSERAQIRGAGEIDEWGSQQASFDVLRGATLSEDGSQLYLSGTFTWNDGLLVLDLKPASATFTEGAEAVALLPGGTLADPQLDALENDSGNYNGASIVVSREDAANSDDVFSFLEGSGVELSADTLVLDGVSIASVSNDGGVLSITFTANVSRADAQRVLRSIAYSNASEDPTAQGSKATFSITLNDGDGFNDQQLVDVNLIGVNDPAIVETTVLSPTFTAEGERVKLFENTRIDTVEAGQAIWYVAITIDNVRPGDVLGVGNGRIALDAEPGSRTTETGQQYNILPRNADGSTTVWIYTTQLPVNEVATLIDSITYGHTGSDTSGQRTVTLAIEEDLPYDPSGQAVSGTTLAESSVVTLVAATTPNTAPTVDGLQSNVPYTEQGAPVLLAPAANVADSGLDAFNDNAGNYDGATLTITLGEGSTAADSLGLQTGNGLTLDGSNLQKDGVTIGQVTMANGTLSITFSDAAGTRPTTADVQNTLRQITYANSSDAPVASVAVSITLTDQRGLASAAQSLTIDITAINDAPVINENPILALGDLQNLQSLSDIAGLGAPTYSAVSSDGAHVYVADAQGNIAHFSRDALSGELTYLTTLPGQMSLVQMLVTPDDSALYVLHTEGSNGLITRFALDDNGSLQQQETTTGPFMPAALALSNDGRNLYVIDQNTPALTIYSVDGSNGALTSQTVIEGVSGSPPYLWRPEEIVVRGEQVFVATQSGLIVYQRTANGDLTTLAFIRSGDTDANGNTVDLSNIQHLAVSADGRTIFIANGWTTRTEGGGWTSEPLVTIRENNPQRIDAFTLDTSTGAFTHAGTITDVPAVESIALSEDGKALFVSRHDGSLAYYSAIALEKMDTSQSGLTGANHISLAADGAVIVSGNSLYVLNAPAIPNPTTMVGGDAVALVPALTLNDAELDIANNYQGASVTINGQAGDRFGLLDNTSYSLDGQRILRDGSEVATLVQTGDSAVLRFTAAISQSDASALLRLISYSSDSGTAGEHRIDLILNDGELNSQTRSVEVTLQAPNQAPIVGLVDYRLSEAKAGQPYSLTLPAELFSDPEGDALSWTVSGLPEGLTFNPATRVITGNTSAMGEYRVQITASDPSGASVELELTLSVSNSAPVIGSPYSLSGATPGADYNVTLPANLFTDANDSTLTWSATDLPDWLSFDPSTRTLSGIAPQVGSHSITITATDPQGAAVSRTLTLNVAQPVVDSVLPVLNNSAPQAISLASTTTFGAPAFDAPLFEPNTGATAQEAPAQPAPTTQNLLRSSTGSGLADGRGTLSEQLANADSVLTDSGQQVSPSRFNFDGGTLRSDVDLNQNTGSDSVELQLPVESADGSTAQRVTLANGLPLPSWASFDARTGELRIDRERLQRDGQLRLTLISRDGEGREQRTPVEIRATQAPTNAEREAPAEPTVQLESLPQRLRQDTSSALLDDALDLLDQLSELADEPLATTRHIA